MIKKSADLTTLEAIDLLQRGANLHITDDGISISIPVATDHQKSFIHWLDNYLKNLEGSKLEPSILNTLTANSREIITRCSHLLAEKAWKDMEERMMFGSPPKYTGISLEEVSYMEANKQRQKANNERWENIKKQLGNEQQEK